MKRRMGILALCACTTFSFGGIPPIIPFTEEAVDRGLVYVVRPYDSATSVFYFGHGCAIADLNGNGHQDIVVLGKADGTVGIFENDGTGHFVDRSEGNGVPKLARGSGLAIADYNGDGMLDIFISQDRVSTFIVLSEPDVLLRNDGNFTFTNVAVEAGVANQGRGQGAAWGDLDNDGWLDLYVTMWTHTNSPPEFFNQLYHNQGDGTFESIGPLHGVDDWGLGFIGVWTDINRNGNLDLYLVNDRGHEPAFPTNRLWRNDGGVLTEISESSGANIGLFGMGAATGDITGNGYVDFYVSNIPFASAYDGKNPLLLNQGDETFIEMSTEAGMDHYKYSWSTVFFDFTNNGHLDLYVSNMFEKNTLYANNGGFPCLDVTEAAQIGGVGDARSFSAAVGDVTGNGALDVLTNDHDLFAGPGQNVRLFINHEGATRNWIRFTMVGYGPNHHAIGGNVEILTSQGAQWREIYAGGNNYKSQNELVFHFGLDAESEVQQIVAKWPAYAATRVLTNYSVNQHWTLYPPEALGDANGDGVINVFDLLALLGSWGAQQPGAEILDFNGDGVINVFDLLGLLGKWGPVQ